MTFQEFTPRMIEAVQKLVGDGYEVKVERIVKNNDQVLTGMAIHEEGAEVSVVPIQYLEPLFAQAEEGVPIRHLARLLVETDKTHKAEGLSLMASDLTSYEEAKDHIFCKLISTERNEERLSSMPHRAWQDLSIVYYREVEGGGPLGGEVRITNELMGMYGISEETLYADAMKNTREQHPYSIEPLASVLAGLGAGDISEGDTPLYLLSSDDKCNGAVCAVFPEAMREAADTFGKNFFIIPSSIHEMLLLADDGEIDVSQLESMIRGINETMVSESEILSDKAYYYDAKTERISLAAEYEAKHKAQEKVTVFANTAPILPSM